jgi:hypothetical protein
MASMDTHADGSVSGRRTSWPCASVPWFTGPVWWNPFSRIML